ncbi:M28 family metallopeptidase [Clostridium thermarum]|uniref:M28 family metallopeptidase n=1 Tax=Clostridium thermarum TaxID=1716543 RepID=UPI00111F3657|nr:M28 family metallopeptidase [Clostridium thermarum]
MKRMLCLIIFIISIIGMTSCKNEQIFDINNYNKKEFVEYLTSDYFKGRLTGTDGNRNTEAFLSEVMEKKGLEKLKGNSFYQEYSHQYYKMDNSNIRLSAKLSNGEMKNFAYGKDFAPQNYIAELDLTATVTLNAYDENFKDSFVILEDYSKVKDIYGKCKGIFVKEDNFKLNINVSQQNFPIVQISDDVYDFFKSTEVSSVELKYSLEQQNILVNNMIGKISGTNERKAIVVSAHFDHVGVLDNILIPGATDNSTGIAVVLDVADKLKKYYEDRQPQSDILICLFNGEESGRQGSTAFVDSIKGEYSSIYNINVDTVGISKDKDLLLICGSSKDKELTQSIDEHFRGRGFKCEVVDEGYESDHISFLNNNIAAVNLGQKSIENIHSSNDKADLVDYEYLERLSDELFSYIIANDKNSFSLKSNNDSFRESPFTEEQEEVIEKSKKELEYGQYKFISINDITILVENSSLKFSKMDQLKDIYDEIYLPVKLGSYSFVLGEIKQEIKPREGENAVKDRVYNMTYNINDIDRIDLTYKHKDTGEVLNIKLLGENSWSDKEHYIIDQTVILPSDFKILRNKEDNNITSIYKQIYKGKNVFHLIISKGFEETVEYQGEKITGIRINWFEGDTEKINVFINENELEKIEEGLCK